MAINRKMYYVVAYDIADPRRLARVHRCLRKAGLPLQYSVFNVYMTVKELQSLLGDLRDLIDQREDDVRAYPLPERYEHRLIGLQTLPDDVMLFRDGGDLMATSRGAR